MRDLAVKLSVSAAIFVVALSLIAVGLWIGFSVKDRALRERLEEAARSQTMGGLLPDEAKEAVAQTYFDPERALAEMDGYSWSAPSVPTPFVGTAPRPGRHGNAIVNALQFRAAADVPAKKPEGEVRLFLTGGSTAFGVGAPSNSTTVGALLQRELNKASDRFAVFTFASPSWTTTHERIAIENRLSEMEPDLVISLSGANDIYWASLGRNILWSRSHQEQYFWLLTREVHRAYGLWSFVDVEDRQSDPVESSVVPDRAIKNVRLARAALEMVGANYLFALQPNLYVTSKPLTIREAVWIQPDLAEYYKASYAQLRNRLARLQLDSLTVSDLTDAFDQLPADQEIFIDTTHFADRGNQLLAERLAVDVLALLGDR